MTTLYVCVVHDRHVDPDIRLFVDRDAALQHAREDFHEAVAYPERIEELDPDEDYLVHLTYPEGDSAWVEAVEVDLGFADRALAILRKIANDGAQYQAFIHQADLDADDLALLADLTDEA